tara:strand:- start:102 stop:254 length:153 start_codon:yes stop_codon:yes gene_type:complete
MEENIGKNKLKNKICNKGSLCIYLVLILIISGLTGIQIYFIGLNDLSNSN